MTVDGPFIQLQDPVQDPVPLWPGFTVSTQGLWHHLRCNNCGKTTSPASLNERLIDGIVRDHRCGPPLSTHWAEAVSLGAWYAVAFNSIAMAVEQMPYGLSAGADVRAGLDRLEEAVLSHRRAAGDVVEQFDRHEQQSLYAAFSRPVRTPPVPVVPARPTYVPPPVPAQAITTPGHDGTEPHGPVYVTVGELLRGCLLPASPGTGQIAIGVVWAPGALCVACVADQLEDGRLADQLGPDEGGVVLYPGDAMVCTGPTCIGPAGAELETDGRAAP